MSGTGRKVSSVLLAFIVLTGLVGCVTGVLTSVLWNNEPSYQTDLCNKYNDQANKHVKNIRELEKGIDEHWDKIDELPDTPEGYREEVFELLAIKAKLGERRTEMENIVEWYRLILKLNVSKDYKKYIRMLKDAMDKRIEANVYYVQSVNEMITMSESITNGTGTLESIEASEKTVDDLCKERDRLWDEATDLEEEADDFYKEKDLGSKS